MASFVNFNNKKEQSLNTYSIRTVKESLFLAETKNPNKIEKLVEGIEGRLTLSEALVLFSDKLNAMSILSHVHANALHVNEGQFSWITYDTDVQIGSERENTIDVYMFDDKGNQWHEKKYEGYGVFGGMDYYELLAKMNGYTEEDLEDKAVLKAIRAMGKAEMRDIGITLAFELKKLKTKAKGNKVLFPALVENPKFPWKRHDFTEEAESDPNQSWYQEPEEDYDDDDDYEQGWYESFMTEAQRVNEWGSSDQSTFLDSMHRDAGKPKKMPSPFDSKLRQAAEDAVDFYWDEWPEYKSDRDGLVDNAVRSYLRRYFKKDFDMMVKMFEVTEHHSENPNDKYEVRHCDKPETPYGVWEGDTLVKCFELEEDAFAFAKEQNKEQGLTEKFSFSKKEVEAAASLIASAIAQADNAKTKVHHLEYDKGRGAGFDISIDGEESAGGSYVVKDNGDVVNAAIGNSQPNAVYSTIGNKSIADVFTNMKKYESVFNEARFVKDFDEAVLKATTQEEVLEIYPNAEFFIGKSDHFFGEFDENLFFKAYYTKGQKEFEIKSIYSEKNSNYVHLYNESVVTEAKGFKNTEDFEEFLKEIDAMPERAIRKIMGKDYIDTPGFYQDEKDNYEDVIDFMISNMGADIYHQLEQWWELNVMTPGLRESINESMSSYYFDSPSEYGLFSNEAPAKAETKYLVMATNKALLNGQEIRLEGSVRFGAASKKQVLGVFDKESEALAFYKSSKKKPEGTMVSFTVGSVVGVTKFRSQYTEIEGHLATAKVK